MKIGCCIGTTVERAQALKRLGYDYAELGVNSFARMDKADFDEMLDGMKACGIPCEAACGFVPKDVKLVGEQADEAVIRQYIEVALERAYALGIKTIVFGSGGARRIPDGMTREQGIEYIVRFLRDIVSDEAKKYDIAIAIEPLCPDECNAINTVDQAIEVAQATGRDNIKALADVYHMLRSDDDITAIADKKGKILHAHTSYPWCDGGKRRYPRPTDTDFDQFPFMNAVYKSGCERLSLEAGCGPDFEKEAGDALIVFREAYARVVDSASAT